MQIPEWFLSFQISLKTRNTIITNNHYWTLVKKIYKPPLAIWSPFYIIPTNQDYNLYMYRSSSTFFPSIKILHTYYQKSYNMHPCYKKINFLNYGKFACTQFYTRYHLSKYNKEIPLFYELCDITLLICYEYEKCNYMSPIISRLNTHHET